jgi:hypothetical protein
VSTSMCVALCVGKRGTGQEMLTSKRAVAIEGGGGEGLQSQKWRRRGVIRRVRGHRIWTEILTA